MKNQNLPYILAAPLTGAVLAVGNVGRADTGFEGATRLEEGHRIENDVVTVSTGDSRLIVSASINRPSAMLFNNTANTMWIAGSASSATPALGFPIPSSATLSLQSMPGDIYGIFDSAIGAGGGNVRVIRGRVK